MSEAITLDPSQAAAVDLATSARFCVITGGPGTGKSTTLDNVLNRWDELGISYALASPTGKAAKRMAETTKRDASTIHRLLGWTPFGFEHCDGNPLPFDAVVIDEASMLDVELASSLFAALRPDARLVLIGDSDQLPSVGPGRVLADLVESGVVPVARLTRVHRAAAESWVCRNAPRVLAGEMPELDAAHDFDFVEAETGEEVARIVGNVMAKDEMNGAQVIVPQRPGPCGVEALNAQLQREMNPAEQGKRELKRGEKLFRVGDRVIQTVNNYSIGVFNGEIGTVADIEGGNITVDLDGRPVAYSGDAVDGLDLAYALTVHKCVAPDTLLETAEGLLPIRDVCGFGRIGTADGPRRYGNFVRNSRAKALRLVADCGYEVTVTPDHRMMAWTGSKYELVEAQDLSAGQFLRLRLGASVDAEAPARLPPLASDLDVRTRRYRAPLEMSEDLAEFLGLFVADGTAYEAGFRLVKQHADVAIRFARLCVKLFGADPRVKQKKNCVHVEVNSRQLSQWLRSIGGLSPNQKAIPECVLRSPIQMHAAFLRGLFEDGTVNVRGRGAALDHVELVTSVHEIARIAQVMLLRLGIISSRVQAKYSRVYIYGENAVRFRDRVGFVSAWKQLRLYAKPGNETRYVVPVDRSSMTRDTIAGRNARNRGYMSRHSAAEQLPQQALEFHHVRITRIEETVSESMCVSVPGYGRFLQNGFDGSNCQGSEFAHVVVIVHSSHTYMLTRQLVYTAITRAKKSVTLVGNRKGLKAALDGRDPPKRNSAIVERIRETGAVT